MTTKCNFVKNRVSVIVPVYGADAFLNECIDSILNQKNLDLEVICVHDESPDNSLNILEKYNKDSPGTLKIIDQNNTGGATAINNGIDASTGEFIMILDCDDFIIGNGLESLHDRIRKDHSDLVISKIYRYENEEYTPVYDSWWILSNYVINTDLQKLKLFQNGMYTGLLFRSEFLKKNNIQMKDGLWIADRPFTALAYAHAQKISVSCEYTCAWRKRNSPESISLTDRLYDKQEINDRVESAEYLHDSLVKNNFHQYKDHYDKDLARRILWSVRRGWATGRFNVSFHSYFYDQSKNYYQKLDNRIFKDFPLYSRLMSQSLKSGSKIQFLIVCFFSYLASLVLDFKKMAQEGTRNFLKAISMLMPIKLVRIAHRFFPQYPSAKQYRRFLRTTSINRSIIIFESNFGKSYSGNPKYIYKYVQEKMPELICVWVNQGTRHEIDGHPNQVKRGTNEYYYYLARAGYWINNIRFPVEHKRDQTVYFQTWHGTPLKKLGFDIPFEGPEVEARESHFRESRNWNYLLAQNEHSATNFKNAFMYEGEIVQFGYPCNDIFYSDNKTELTRRIKNHLQIDPHKKVVLYAPTWRDSDQVSKWQFKSQAAIDYSRWIERIDPDTILLVREHHLVQAEPIDEEFANQIKNVSQYDDVSELLLITDCLITDYSSIFFDFLNAEKLIVFYMYDRESYVTSMRPFYLDDLEELPGPIVTEFDTLIQSINNSTNLLEQYANQLVESKKMYCPNDDGEASKRVVRKLFS